jgi:hypothetical protein
LQGRRRNQAFSRECTPGDLSLLLFCGSNAGGERAAAIYALLGSAKLNGLDPEIYLHHVLERIADHPITQIAELLPWNVTINTPTITPQA